MLRFILLVSCSVVLCFGDTECGSKEELRCVKPCPPERTCRNRGIQFSCIQVETPCENKCICKPGYFRNSVGDCITDEECDLCQGANEYFACSSFCDNECATLDTQNKTNCPIQSFVCNRKCYCDDGYARDDKGNCIVIESCNTETEARVRRDTDVEACPENEVFTDCKKSCPPEICLSILARFKCDSKEPCKKGCICKPGYLRQNDDTPCVPICQCPEMRNAPECK